LLGRSGHLVLQAGSPTATSKAATCAAGESSTTWSPPLPWAASPIASQARETLRRVKAVASFGHGTQRGEIGNGQGGPLAIGQGQRRHVRRRRAGRPGAEGQAVVTYGWAGIGAYWGAGDACSRVVVGDADVGQRGPPRPGNLEDLRSAAGNLDEALRRIVEATHQLFAVDGAGLLLVDPDQLVRNVADRRVDDLEELQIEHGEGPCGDAFEDKTWSIPRIWPARPVGPGSARPRSSGAAGGVGQPDSYNQHAIGVVVVFSAKVHPWSPEGSWPWWPSPTWPP
jgi:hypothetical protein